jgi:hypothetical protein
MKLKRYVLLDNNLIYDREKLDTTNAYGHLMSNIFKAIENEEENVCRQLVATSDDVFDLIRKDDLIARHFEILNVVVKMADDSLGIITERRYFHNIKDIKNSIQAIYKPIDNDYICMWKRRKDD